MHWQVGAATRRAPGVLPNELRVEAGYSEQEMQLFDSVTINKVKSNDTYPHDEDNDHSTNQHRHGPCKPVFTIFRAESHLKHITHEFRMARKLFTKDGTRRRHECSIGASEGSNSTKGKVCNRVVSVKPH